MTIYEIITKKRDGGELTTEEIQFFVNGYTAGDIADYQASALLMAICIRGMNDRETLDLSLAMRDSGDVMDLSALPGVKVDKHSTGGVGDKTSLVIVPIAAAAGVTVAKMSGRGLAHTGGTVDKLESIPGFCTETGPERFFEIVREVGCAIVAQTGELVPADKKMYALRDVTGTVESIPLIASSILSKKLASGTDGIVFDVTCGEGAFMKTPEEAHRLAELMVRIAQGAGKRAVALVTDMENPLGHAVGNNLEVKEALEVLKGEGPQDLREVCLALAADMIHLGTGLPIEKARQRAEDVLEDGSAAERLRRMVAAQGGDVSYLDSPEKFPVSKICEEVPAEEDGYVQAIDALRVGRLCVALGAGRVKKGDAVDPTAGVVLRKKVGDPVKKGEVLAVLHYNNSTEKNASAELKAAYTVGKDKPAPVQYIYERVTV